MRPKPRMPSVFSYSSTPENFERSHLPGDQRRVRLRDVARERQQQRHRVLGGGHDVRLGRVGDDDPAPGGGRRRRRCRRRRRRGRSTFRRSARSISSAVSFVAERIRIPSYSPIRSRELLLVPVDPEIDVEVLAQQLDAGVADLLLDEHPRALGAGSRRSAPAAAALIADPLDDPVDAGGQRLHVGGLDGGEHADPQLVAPELAVGLDVDDAVRAQRRRDARRRRPSSSKSIVPTTSERFAGSATNGVA